MRRTVPLLVVVLGLALALAALLGGWLRERSADPWPALEPLGESAPPAERLPAAPPPAAAPLAEPRPAEAAPLAEPARPADAAPQRAPALDAELADALWVAGRVVLPPGTPLDEEAYVVGRGRRFESRDLHRVRVAPDGRFEVAFASDSRFGRVVLEARYLVQTDVPRLDFRGEEPREPVVLAPELGARLVVRATPPVDASDAQRADLERAEVELDATPGLRGETELTPPERRVALGADLEVAFDALPCGLPWDVRLAPGSLVAERRERLELEPGETRVVELALVTGAVVSGRVVDEAGAPVAGATLYLSGTAGQGRRRPLRATTDGEGSFRLVAVPPGESRLSASHPEWLASESLALEGVADGETRAGLELVLTRGATVAGRVVDAAGEPAGAGVEVRVADDARPDGTSLRGAITDAQGGFRVTGIDPRERYAVTAEGSGGTSGRTRGVAPGATDVVVVLGAGERLAGRVVDPLGGPVPRATVRVHRVSADGLAFASGRPDRTARVDDPAGAFELEGFEPGTWLVEAEAEGFADALPERVTLPQAAPLVLRLRPLARLAGRVVDAAGRGIADARVIASAAANWSAVGLVQSGALQRVRTEADGRFLLDGVPPGRLTLVARAAGYAQTGHVPVDVDPLGTTDVEIVLRVPGALEVELHESLEERAGRELTVHFLEGQTHEIVRTDAAGRARLADLSPGEYVVMLAVLEPPATPVQARTSVAAGETTRLVLGAPVEGGVRLVGRVLRGGAGVAGVGLRAVPRGVPAPHVAAATTDAAGRFELALAGPGEHRVYLSRAGLPHDAVLREIDVPDAPLVERDFELGTARIAGRVTRADGAPAADHRVRAWRDGSAPEVAGFGSLRTAETDGDGRYVLEDLEAGTWNVCAGGGSGPWGDEKVAGAGGGLVREGLALASGAELAGVDLALPAAGTVTGTVVDAAGATVGDLSLEVRDARGVLLPPLYGTFVGSDGRLLVDGLPPGEVTLVLRGLRDGEPEERGRASVTVRAGETTDARIVLDD